MAPTICPEKKRQIRSSSIKIVRHLSRNALNTNPGSASISCITTGSISSSSLRLRATSAFCTGPSSSSKSDADNEAEGIHKDSFDARGSSATRTPAAGSRLVAQQKQAQISDDLVSSSTSANDQDLDESSTSALVLNSSRSSITSQSSFSGDSNSYQSSDQATDETDMDTDADDTEEVHSINSASKHKFPATRTRQTVFNAPALSEKQLARPCASSAKNSKTYSNMCEIQNTEGLLSIAIKTIKLVKRNQMLQRRLAELQLETSDFIQSVLANPENKRFREKIQQKSQKTENHV